LNLNNFKNKILSINSSLTLLLTFPVFLDPQAVILPLCKHTIYIKMLTAMSFSKIHIYKELITSAWSVSIEPTT